MSVTLSDWKTTIDWATSLRRELHQAPELTWEEHATAARIRAELDAMGIAWKACANIGTIATLAPQAPGRCIALRADMDALPIVEVTGVEWISKVSGKMHACGHDGHTAVLLAVTRWLKQHESSLSGPVRLLFQPAEEGGHGARAMIEDGALEGVDWVFGWHNWPAIPYGQAACPDGAVMAANGAFTITLHGRGGHASQPESCRDPVLAAAALIQNIQQIIARRIAPQSSAVVSVTTMQAGSAVNVIPDTAQISGGVRASDTDDRTRIAEWLNEIAEATARTYGVEAEVEFRPGYGATVNHSPPAEHYRGALREVFGPAWQTNIVPIPIMASEDFSYYLQVVPGAFALIGAGEEADHCEPCHSPRYDFNDRLIDPVGRLLAQLVGIRPTT